MPRTSDWIRPSKLRLPESTDSATSCPSLIASIYGMNFKTMPELDWHYGYPIAILVMILAAVLPYVYFKWRKWL